jgi:rod shape-determining protein MreD
MNVLRLKSYQIAALLIVCVIAQGTILHSWALMGVIPDLLLILIVWLSVGRRLVFCLVFAAIAGALKDAFSVYSTPVYTLLYPLWCVIIARLSRKLTLEPVYLRVVLVFLAAIVNGIIMRLYHTAAGNYVAAGIFARTLFIEPVYTAACAFLIFEFLP